MKGVFQVPHNIEIDGRYCGLNCPQRRIDTTMGRGTDGCRLFRIDYLRGAGGLRRYRCDECLRLIGEHGEGLLK